MPECTATTVSVTLIEPAAEAKVRLMIEMIIVVHRLEEVGEQMLHEAMGQVRDEKTQKGKCLVTL
jgi:hypothetical protein